jgi:inorganic pyrophosphatase
MRNPLDIPLTVSDGVVNAVVESPAGSTGKIKWEPSLGEFALSRPLPLGLAYPHDWGFLPRTRAPDGDPLDVLVLSETTTFPGLVIPVRPLGVLRLEQNEKGGASRERNDRLIAVANSAVRSELRNVAELSARLREELEQFFLNAVFFQAKDPTILGWGPREEAWALIRAASIPVEREAGRTPWPERRATSVRRPARWRRSSSGPLRSRSRPAPSRSSRPRTRRSPTPSAPWARR